MLGAHRLRGSGFCGAGCFQEVAVERQRRHAHIAQQLQRSRPAWIVAHPQWVRIPRPKQGALHRTATSIRALAYFALKLKPIYPKLHDCMPGRR